VGDLGTSAPDECPVGGSGIGAARCVEGNPEQWDVPLAGVDPSIIVAPRRAASPCQGRATEMLAASRRR
jgi:hypothetical protein